MMERDHIVVRQFFIFVVEGLDEVDVFRDRGDDDDVRSGQSFFVESFAEKLRIELQRLFDELFGERILLDEIIGLVPILDYSVVFVHLFQCAHPEIERIHGVIESVLDLDGFSGMLGNIEQHEIIFFEIVSEEDEGVERLGENIDILYG